MADKRLSEWHEAVLKRDPTLLGNILADDVEFHSPFFWIPKKSKEQTFFILMAVSEIFENFYYHREWIEGDDMALEFEAHIGDVIVKGIDLIHFNTHGKIDHFEVMIRPMKALAMLGEMMSKKFEAFK